jgi:hypothetical protein
LQKFNNAKDGRSGLLLQPPPGEAIAQRQHCAVTRSRKQPAVELGAAQGAGEGWKYTSNLLQVMADASEKF